jgi:hypothetical protein
LGLEFSTTKVSSRPPSSNFVFSLILYSKFIFFNFSFELSGQLLL